MHRHYYFIHIYCYIDSLACMRLSLYSRYIEHCSCYMDYRYMSMSVFSLHDYFPLLILIFSLLDMWAVNMRCVESYIYCFPFYVILFLIINRAHVLLSCYMYPCIVLVPDTLCSLNIINIICGWEKLDD